MTQTLYTEDHEYIRVDGDIGTIGITDYAQSQLGDIVFVDLPQPGKTVVKGGELCVIESVKAASDVYAPASGEIVDINGEIEASSGVVNEDAMGRGWLVKLRLTNPAELQGLMDDAAYDAFLKSL